MAGEPKSLILTMRVSPELYEAAQRAAAVSHRSVSGLASYALERFIDKNFPAAFDPTAKLVITTDDAPYDRRVS